MTQLIEEQTTESIIGAFYQVYNILGFGFFEHIYLMALEHELVLRGHRVEREVSVQVKYKNLYLSQQRLDMIVDGKIIVEAKSTAEIPTTARRQIFNYLSATNMEVGLLLHFGPKARFYRLVRWSPKKVVVPVPSAESVQSVPAVAVIPAVAVVSR